MVQLRAGDQDVAAHVFHYYASHLISLVRGRLDRRILRKEDPEDVVQSAFRSFFRRHAKGEFELDDWDSLAGLLATITLRKCGHRIERFNAARRDIHRESAAPASADDSVASWEAISREPTPLEAALATETLEEVMRDLQPCHREIVPLVLDGYSLAQISAHVCSSERTVQRVLKLVRSRLERLRGEE
jgi:RNA polymerase sigma-70 factor (ECF subfamily)